MLTDAGASLKIEARSRSERRGRQETRGEVERGTYSVAEAAARLGVSRNHIYELVARDEFPGVIKLGSKILISKIAVEGMLDPEAAVAAPA